jgi:deoxyuridine 5'-triphosphate nucleotidohydrolase
MSDFIKADGDISGDLMGPYPKPTRVSPVFSFAIRQDLVSGTVGNGSLFVPARGTDRSSGWDVRAALHEAKDLVVRAGTHIKIPLGFRVLAPEGWWLELRPRSSTFAKKQLHALYGVIDEDYEGECMFACQYLPDMRGLGNDLTIKFGEAIGQLIPVRRQEMVVREVTNADYDAACKARDANRGAGGFGSTGK